jgi:predicted RNA binding protein YcfA (HicA-like mRNA interferase family)
VSNSHRTLKQGDKRIYTVGFRSADPVVAGTISYEP